MGIGMIETVNSIEPYNPGQPGYEYLIKVIGSRNQYKPVDMTGIPLTPEVLRDCGFETDTEFGNQLQHPHLKCRWVDRNLSGDTLDKPYLRFDSTGRPPFIKTDIYYLHQLQNLYFALTQTELTYKPS